MTAHILQLSDIHFSDSSSTVQGRDPHARLSTVIEACVASGVAFDLVLLTGDLTDDGGVGACRRVAAALDRLGAPVLAVPGNHDTATVVDQVFPGGAAEVGGWRIVGVDTSRPGAVHGTVDVDRLFEQLDGLDDRPTLLAMHHPPLSPSSHPWFQLDGAPSLLSGLVTRPQVVAIAAGHLHQAFEQITDSGIRVLGGPSTLIGFAHDQAELVADGSPAGARHLQLDADRRLTSEVWIA